MHGRDKRGARRWMRQSLAHRPATIVAQRRPASGAKQQPRGTTIARTAAHHLRNVCARLATVSSSSSNQVRPARWVFSQLPCWRLGAWLRPASRGNRHFTVGGGRLRQSGPRPEGRLLRQPALEGLTRSAQTETPQKVGRNKIPAWEAAAAQSDGGGGGGDLGEEGGVCF
ncbi:hypothetical protein F511_04438 [Dorcoceras hygrometricum]|uniref:Uncharacterized protein n=1 Tax=Dorcoceras hygrometricum TaxID=472368 RepID=A0A2Z7CWW5_9LAMI|nr:hypothetical protein F511_04438 [Dorcoceras hygrometricum]